MRFDWRDGHGRPRLASVLLSLTALAGVAGAVPALRAVRTDPIRTLKS
jgi:hypothetical protein